ncbi:hypothetical protein [Streptomyces prunicolor]
MYVQESRIIVRIAEHPTNYPTMVFTMEMGENSLGGDAILEELRNIAFLDGQLEFPEMHVVSGREGQTNWGASGSFGEYIIEISANILSTAGAAGVAFVTHKALSKIRGRNEASSGRLSLDEARSLLKTHITLHYQVPGEELTEVESTTSLVDGVFDFTFVASDATEYGGQVGGEEPLQCTKVWRKSPGLAIRPEYRNPLN